MTQTKALPGIKPTPEGNFFGSVSTVEEAKTLYRQLIRQFHPDLHPEDKEAYTRLTQRLNEEYTRILEDLDGQTSCDAAGEEHTYYFNSDREQALVNKIDELYRLFATSEVTRELGYNPMTRKLDTPIFKPELGFDMHYEVEIYLIGAWIWIAPHGTITRPYSKLLGGKGAGCKWHSNRNCWYWKGTQGRHRRSKGDLAHLASQYGGRRLRADEE